MKLLDLATACTKQSPLILIFLGYTSSRNIIMTIATQEKALMNREETQDEREMRLAHNLYMRFYRSVRSYFAAFEFRDPQPLRDAASKPIILAVLAPKHQVTSHVCPQRPTCSAFHQSADRLLYSFCMIYLQAPLLLESSLQVPYAIPEAKPALRRLQPWP